MFQFSCPDVGNQPQIKRICRLCNSSNVIIHQRYRKTVRDSVLSEVEIIRLRCKSCKYSFRIYPEGVGDWAQRTKRLIFLGIILYSAGLSYEKCEGFLSGMLGRRLSSFVTIWRDVQTIGERLRRSKLSQVRAAKVVVGLDGTYVRVRGREQPVLVATNSTDGTLVTVSLNNEWQERQLRQFVQEVAKELGLRNIAGIVTDDLDTYKLVSTRFKLTHQVCLGHVKKNLGKRLAKLKSRIPKPYIERLRSILDPPSASGDLLLKDLLRDDKLWRRGKSNKHWVSYRMIIGDLLRNWHNYTAYLRNPRDSLPTTNNVTERAIGRSKIRYKLTRGFKSQEAVLNFFFLTQYTGMHQFEKIASVC